MVATAALFRQVRRNIGIELRTPIYFDANATTPVDPRVQRAMSIVQRSCFGNPSSLHAFGSKAREAVEEARVHVARTIGAEPSEVVFTSGGTEANTTVIRSVARTKAHGHFITSSIEHPSVLHVFRALETEGHRVTYLGVDADGRVSADDVERSIGPETLLISVMHVNNELGTIQPVEEIARIAVSHRILFHCDAVQSLGKLPLDVRTLPVDYLSMSAHKINGPKGAGALYIRSGSPLHPLLIGGHQERLLRAGTENVAAIAGFGQACSIVESIDRPASAARCARIKAILIEGLRSVVPDTRINGADAHSLPSTLNVTLPGIQNSEMLAYLDFNKIAVSVGSACVAGSTEVSHVLAALGLNDDDIRCSFRISFGRGNTEKEALSFVATVRRFARERNEFFSYTMPGNLTMKECMDGSGTVADLRNDEQRREHPSIPGAVVIAPSMKQLRTLPRERTIVLVCEDGYLSNIFSVRLRQAGWKNVTSLLGGYKRWRQYHRDEYYYQIRKDAAV